jgi:hypothetical protein
MLQEQKQLEQESNRIKLQNKALFQSVASHQESKILGQSSAELNSLGQSVHPGGEEVELADIHGLYQDLFLTDIRQEVEQAQNELKQCKVEQNTAQIDY